MVELAGPPGETPYTVDSPTGRRGDEAVEIIAKAAATYRLRIRPYDGSRPGGTSYRLRVGDTDPVWSSPQRFKMRL